MPTDKTIETLRPYQEALNLQAEQIQELVQALQSALSVIEFAIQKGALDCHGVLEAGFKALESARCLNTKAEREKAWH